MSWEIWAGPIRPTVEELPRRVVTGSHPWPTSERQTAVDISRWDTPDFREQAVCAESDPEVFFPDKGDSAAPAKSLCRICPAVQECLTWAMQHNEQRGIWGGLSVDERKKLRRKAS